MTETSRRSFLSQSAGSLASAAALGIAAGAAAKPDKKAAGRGASDQVVLGIIGCGGRGMFHAKGFSEFPDVRIAYLCDVDSNQLSKPASRGIKGAKTVGDLRKVLDDKSVDAVVIATPDHWHTPAALVALAAGKHVYVEKPVSHNIREGRLLFDAEKQHKDLVVQVGTQSRSTPHIQKPIQMIKEGKIGQVLVSKAWNSQMRGNIGHGKPGAVPAGFDYDNWVGPSVMVPYQANRAHYGWHWWYDFGTGDMGNDGVHEVDIARWGLGVDTHPTTVAVDAGKMFFDDDQQFPDTQFIAFDYPGDGKLGNRRQLIFEMRIWSPYRQEDIENGVAFYGTEGMLMVGKHQGWKLYGKGGKLVEQDFTHAGADDTAHKRNFIESIKGNEKPNASVWNGHLSAALCHLGNIGARVGRPLKFNPVTEQIVADQEANALVKRKYRAGYFASPKNV